ncbi:MAG: ABC transporter permease [Sulfobacillus sp.]
MYRGRGLLRALTERDIRVRYKQAHLGVAWAVISPAVLMIIFTLLISRGVLNVSTGGKPIYLYSYVALVPWTFFANVISQGGMSLVTNLYLVNKINCPREVFPLASALVCAVDALVATLLLLVLFLIGGTAPSAMSVWVPLLLLIEVVFTLGATLIVSIVTVYMRDLRHLLAILVQFGMFATPVMYSMSNIPGKHLNNLPIPQHLLTVYSVVNPLGPVIDGIRRTVLFDQPPQWQYLGPAAAMSMFVLIGGLVLFKRLEYGIADVA